MKEIAEQQRQEYQALHQEALQKRQRLLDQLSMMDTYIVKLEGAIDALDKLLKAEAEAVEE